MKITTYGLELQQNIQFTFFRKSLILKYGGHDGQLSKNLHGIEQYRIQSLEKILGSTDLNDGYYRAAVKMLLKKILIFKSGLAKRNKKVEYLTFQKKFDYWSKRASSLRYFKISCRLVYG